MIEKYGKSYTEIARNALVFFYFGIYIYALRFCHFTSFVSILFHHINQHQIILTSQNTIILIYYKNNQMRNSAELFQWPNFNRGFNPDQNVRTLDHYYYTEQKSMADIHSRILFQDRLK